MAPDGALTSLAVEAQALNASIKTKLRIAILFFILHSPLDKFFTE
jgi:hypothetical protein